MALRIEPAHLNLNLEQCGDGCEFVLVQTLGGSILRTFTSRDFTQLSAVPLALPANIFTVRI